MYWSCVLKTLVIGTVIGYVSCNQLKTDISYNLTFSDRIYKNKIKNRYMNETIEHDQEQEYRT